MFPLFLIQKNRKTGQKKKQYQAAPWSFISSHRCWWQWYLPCHTAYGQKGLKHFFKMKRNTFIKAHLDKYNIRKRKEVCIINFNWSPNSITYSRNQTKHNCLITFSWNYTRTRHMETRQRHFIQDKDTAWTWNWSRKYHSSAKFYNAKQTKLEHKTQNNENMKS